MKRRDFCLATTATLLLAATAAMADATLAPVFTDHMVLQRESEVPVWGWARPGEHVQVRGSWNAPSGGAEARAVADAGGRWTARVRTGAAGGPYTLTVSSDGPDGRTITLGDILLGEVWLCSGQSNMEWPLEAANGAAEAIAAADRPQIRLLQLDNTVATRPQGTVRAAGGGWQPCTPEAARGFSAVGYFFGTMLNDELQVPVGLISADWGGTRVQAWMPESSLAELPAERSALELVRAMDPDPAIRARRLKDVGENWWDRLDGAPDGAGPNWAQPAYDDGGWSAMRLPATLAGDGLEGFDGIVYFRRTVDVPTGAAGEPAMLELGPIDDRDDAFINGIRVGGTRIDGQWSAPRRYQVPAGVLRAGRNVVAVRILDTAGPGGINGRAEQMQLVPKDGPAIPLAGEWRFKRGPAMAKLPPIDSGPRLGPNAPTVLYNGMIAPLAPMRLGGVVWYQGESNRGEPEVYAQLFPEMIRNWRAAFDDPRLPFLFVQIAPFAYGGDRGEAAELREAQARALALPATGMAVTLDIGDPKDIHPRDKRTVGDRLARQALAIAYGRNDADPQGPVYAGHEVQDGRVRIRFDHANGGLSPAKGSLDGFVVAGPDRRFFVADATVQGNEVVVSSPKVPNPVAVRYAWSAAPQATLFGKASDGSLLPAAPFRTDDWVRPADGWPPPQDGGATAHRSADPAMKPIFNGHDLSGWTNINCAPGTFTVQDGMIHCTGVPTGLLRTDRMYENYELELEWRHLSEQGNAGLFIWSDALTAPGQPFSRAVEVQVMVGAEGDWYTSDGDVFPIHGATMTPENGRGGSRAFPTEKRMKPSPEWNHYLVTCNNGEVSLAVNGKVVTRGRNATPRKGYICLESEGTPIDFRNIRIKELPPASPPLAPELVATADEGFRTLYTGVDLSGWKVGPEQQGHWQPADWVLRYDGGGADLWTERSFRDFQMVVDWRLTRAPVETERPLIGSDGNEIQGSDGKTKTALVADAGDSGIYLRGSSKSQVNIWYWPVGSGEVWGYRTDGSMPAAVRAAATPRERADNPPGQWNRFVITMKGDQLTVVLNGRTVIENAVLPGVPPEGPIGLQHHGDPIEFANIFVRELGG